MQLATVLTPASTENLQVAAQCGVTDMVTRYLGPSLAKLESEKAHFQRFGLRLSVVEGYLPMERIKFGQDDGTELDLLKTLVRNMGKVGIPVLCYNFMVGTDWVRTKLDVFELGGARVTAFRIDDVDNAILLGHDGTETVEASSAESFTTDQLWTRLESLLRDIVPVAEEADVTLAMHPDDPPLLKFDGKAHIMNSVESFERLM